MAGSIGSMPPGMMARRKEKQASAALRAQLASSRDAKAEAMLKNVKAAEVAFAKLMKTGRVKDIQKAKQQIMAKYGVWPNGDTN